MHFCTRKKLFLFKRFQRKYRLMESEKKPFQFIRNKLNHKSFAVYCLCCLNNCKQNKLHWCNTHCCLLQSHCLVSSRNTLSLLPLRDESEQMLRGGYANMQDLIIGIWSRALLRPHELMRSSGTWASERSVRALVLIISARFPANLSPTCLTMYTQSRPLRGGLRFTTRL